MSLDKIDTPLLTELCNRCGHMAAWHERPVWGGCHYPLDGRICYCFGYTIGHEDDRLMIPERGGKQGEEEQP